MSTNRDWNFDQNEVIDLDELDVVSESGTSIHDGSGDETADTRLAAMPHAKGSVFEEGPCYFWTIPPELRDMVYDLLYGDTRTIKMKCRGRWKANEHCRRMRERGDFMPTAFPESDLAPLLVSKQFFEEAARVWVKSKTFQVDHVVTLGNMRWPAPEVDRALLQHISSLKITRASNDFHEQVEWLPNLLDVTSTVYPRELRYGDKVAGLDDYTDEELLTTSYARAMLPMRGLRSLTIEDEYCHKLAKPEELAKWKKLVQQLRRLLCDTVTHPREPSGSNKPPVSFNAALAAAMAAKKGGKHIPLPPTWTSTGTFKSLEFHEIPETEDEVMRLVLSRPKATLEWMRNAKSQLTRDACQDPK